LTLARNAQKEFLIGQSQGHTRHIADHLWMTSSFNSHRHSVENQNLKFELHNMETYNTLFKLEELISAITKSKDSGIDPDEIHYQILKHHPDVTLETLLQIINDCCISGSFPSSCHQVVMCQCEVKLERRT